MHAYTLYSAVRPFGASCILASFDPHSGPEMYMIEPSGSSYVSCISVKISLVNQKFNKNFKFLSRVTMDVPQEKQNNQLKLKLKN